MDGNRGKKQHSLKLLTLLPTNTPTLLVVYIYKYVYVCVQEWLSMCACALQEYVVCCVNLIKALFALQQRNKLNTHI